MGRSRSAPRSASSASAAASRPKPAASPTPASSTSSSSYSAPPRPSPPPHSAPAPMHASGPAPPPAMASSGGGGGFLSGLMGSVVTGAAMGTGSAVAHRAVDSFMGPRTVVHEHQPAQPAAAAAAPAAMSAGGCDEARQAFANCVAHYDGETGPCQSLMEALQACKRGGFMQA